MSEQKLTRKFVGLHLSGPNAAKTALVILREHGASALSTTLHRVYDRVGPAKSKLYSDERLFDIFSVEGPFTQVVTDCPLTVPPCVACQRSLCPGVIPCEDVGVAYMLALSESYRERTKRKKPRSFNPQAQRLFDVQRLLNDDVAGFEPSYSSNMAPLVVRAQTLQKRLNGLRHPVMLKETNVPMALPLLLPLLGLDAQMGMTYRSFELGKEVRCRIIEQVIKRKWLLVTTEDEDDVLDDLSGSVEVFHAFVCALMALLIERDWVQAKPSSLLALSEWVFLPEVSES